MYAVYTVFEVNGKLEEYFYGRWVDSNTANEVALKLREEIDCFSTVVYKED